MTPQHKLTYEDANGDAVVLRFENKTTAMAFNSKARENGIFVKDWCQFDTIQTGDFDRLIDGIKNPEAIDNK